MAFSIWQNHKPVGIVAPFQGYGHSMMSRAKPSRVHHCDTSLHHVPLLDLHPNVARSVSQFRAPVIGMSFRFLCRL